MNDGFYTKSSAKARAAGYTSCPPPTLATADLHDVLCRHEERVNVLEPFELCLVDPADDARVVGRELDRFVCELGREVGQVLVALQPAIEKQNLDGTIRLSNDNE